MIPHAPFPVVDDAADAADTGDASDLRLASEMSEELTVLFSGTIRPYKGLEHFVQAYEHVRNEYTLPWKLLVVGKPGKDGPFPSS